jgi:hypothetical protein
MPTPPTRFLLLLALCCAVAAPVAAYRPRVMATLEAGPCRLLVETDEDSGTLRLRVHPDGRGCRIEKAAMIAVLAAAFTPSGAPIPQRTHPSLCIGRLVDYPWLSQYLAATAFGDPAWNRRRGKPVAMDINQYVGAVLSRKEVTAQIQEAVAAGGYRVVGATVEKVLVGGFSDVPGHAGKPGSARVPFDAIVWFRLERR